MAADRLRALMRLGRQGVLILAIALALALLGVAGCGGEELSHEAEEGVPIELGDLEFNVQLSRFLNPTDPQDSEYLAGQQVPPPPGESYLAVFMTIGNKSDEPQRLPGPGQVDVVDTTGTAYEATPSNTDFAVPLGSTLPPDGEIPPLGSAAQTGSVEGALVLFLVGRDAPENRPLELEIEHEGETGTVTLDI
jgi:hypothetical protein